MKTTQAPKVFRVPTNYDPFACQCGHVLGHIHRRKNGPDRLYLRGPRGTFIHYVEGMVVTTCFRCETINIFDSTPGPYNHVQAAS